MRITLIVFALAIMAFIFVRAYRRTRRAQRIKVSPSLLQNHREQEAALRNKSTFRNAMSWKRHDIDYKELNTTFSQADYNYSKGNLSAAEQGFIRVIAIKPDHADANNKLGLIYSKLGQFKKAEEIFRFLTEHYPNKATYYSNLGYVLCSLGNLSAAAVAYSSAVKLESHRPERFLRLGQVYYELQQHKQAISAFSKALELNPRQEEVYFTITDILDEIQAYSEAIATLKAMLEYFPYNDKAKGRILDFRRKLELSPLSSEQNGQMQRARHKQNSLFSEIPPGESISQQRDHQELSTNPDQEAELPTSTPSESQSDPKQLQLGDL